MYVSYTAFRFLYTTPAIDIVDGHGLSNETCRQFQPGGMYLESQYVCV